MPAVSQILLRRSGEHQYVGPASPREASARGTSPHVLQAVAHVVEGTPQVDTYAVANSTFHTIAARVAA
jgi:hypothetical protein